MTVFNLYLKILNKNKIAIIVYIVIFTILTLIMVNTIYVQDSFSNTKVDIAFIDDDNTEYTNNLKDYISDYAVIKNIKKEDLEDAFFYRDIEMIIEIPQGFTNSLASENKLNIETKTIPDSAQSVTLQRAMEKYINLSRVYIENDLKTDNLHQSLKDILDNEAKVNINSKIKVDYTNSEFYFNYLAYVLLAMLVTVIGSIMTSFRPIEIKRRNNLGSVSNKKMNLILLISNLLLGIFIWLIFIIISIILYSDIMLKTNGLLLMINCLIFLFTVISIAYLFVVIFKSGNVIGALATV